MTIVDIGVPDRRFSEFTLPPFRGGTTRDAAVFRARLEGYREHIKRAAHKTLQRVLAETLTQLAQENPVGDPTFWKRPRAGYVGGHSRRNWQVKLVPQAVAKPGVDPAAVMTEGLTEIARLPMGTRKAYLVNPVPYMERLNRGWSRQAPVGWIDAVLQRVLAKYRRVR